VLGEGEATARGIKFGEAFQYTTEKVGLEARVGKLATLFQGKKFISETQYVHEYVKNYVRKTLARNKEYAAAGKEFEPESKNYVFLEELAKQGYSEKKIQDELLNILLAGRDTTASLLAHLWYTLARRPDVFNKLRAEVLSLGNKEPSFEQIKEMKYLQYCLNEGRFHRAFHFHNLTPFSSPTSPYCTSQRTYFNRRYLPSAWWWSRREKPYIRPGEHSGQLPRLGHASPEGPLWG
jgi:hypothetical protein